MNIFERGKRTALEWAKSYSIYKAVIELANCELVCKFIVRPFELFPLKAKS